MIYVYGWHSDLETKIFQEGRVRRDIRVGESGIARSRRRGLRTGPLLLGPGGLRSDCLLTMKMMSDL